jgi:putative endonuclease
MKKSKWWIYLLRCSDGSFYTGSTTDHHRRFKEHSEEIGAKYTRGRLPVKVHFVFGPLGSRSIAQKLENLVKKQSHEWKSRISTFELMGAILTRRLK